jgi:hypothetical protein
MYPAAHGVRSGFRDWAAECTSCLCLREVAEMAQAHTVGAKFEAACRRGDLFTRRRQLMDAWARFCRTTSIHAQVVPIRTQG